jgi:hypothetical protein
MLCELACKLRRILDKLIRHESEYFLNLLVHVVLARDAVHQVLDVDLIHKVI